MMMMLACADRYTGAAASLAIWHVGAVVALPPNGREETIDALCAERGIAILLHDGGGRGGIDLRPWLADQAEPVPSHAIEPPRFASSRPIVCLFTSGSTGAHLACLKTAGQLLGEARLLCGFSTWAPERGCWPPCRPPTSTDCSSASWSPSWAAARWCAGRPITRRRSPPRRAPRRRRRPVQRAGAPAGPCGAAAGRAAPVAPDLLVGCAAAGRGGARRRRAGGRAGRRSARLVRDGRDRLAHRAEATRSGNHFPASRSRPTRTASWPCGRRSRTRPIGQKSSPTAPRGRRGCAPLIEFASRRMAGSSCSGARTGS